MSDIRIELMACESTLLREIAEPKAKRRDIAKTYALALRSSERDSVDWRKVNMAIIERWSRSALEWIKRLAHSGKAFDGTGTQSFLAGLDLLNGLADDEKAAA